MKNYDDDIRMLMRRDSVSSQLAAFALAAVFGFVSGAAALQAREVMLFIFRRMIFSAELKAAQYGGFSNLAEIGTITVLVAIWLILVLIVWHRTGKTDRMPDRLKICGAWSAAAAAIYAVLHIAGVMM